MHKCIFIFFCTVMNLFVIIQSTNSHHHLYSLLHFYGHFIDSSHSYDSRRIFCSCLSITALTAGQISPEDFWIGLRDESGNNTDFRWTRDGANLTFTNWAALQPDRPSDQCTATSAFLTFTGQWFDSSCDVRYPPICETDKVSQKDIFKIILYYRCNNYLDK